MMHDILSEKLNNMQREIYTLKLSSSKSGLFRENRSEGHQSFRPMIRTDAIRDASKMIVSPIRTSSYEINELSRLWKS